MESRLAPRFVIVDLENLCYINADGLGATYEFALKFNSLEHAEEYLRQSSEAFKNKCAIYQADTYVTLTRQEFGKDIEKEPAYLIKHNVGKVNSHYSVESILTEKEDLNND